MLVVKQRTALEGTGSSDVQHTWTKRTEQLGIYICPLCTLLEV